jgi:hypothetical protein
VVKFNHLKNRVRCYAHIVNICSSHIIASFTSVPETYITSLSVPPDPDYAIYDDANADVESNHSDDSDDDDLDVDADYEFNLPGCYRSLGSSQLREWATWIKGIRRDPLRRARRVIRLLRSSDTHRAGLRKLIIDGNKSAIFTMKDPEQTQPGQPRAGDKRIPVSVPDLELLRDVKTRWDSVYLMLRRLRQLRPVSLFCFMIGQRRLKTTWHRLSTCTSKLSCRTCRIASYRS